MDLIRLIKRLPDDSLRLSSRVHKHHTALKIFQEDAWDKPNAKTMFIREGYKCTAMNSYVKASLLQNIFRHQRNPL